MRTDHMGFGQRIHIKVTKTSNNDPHYPQLWQVQKGMQTKEDRTCPEEDKDSMV